ncbi:MAG: Gfo/Idh/MocA family oxidoreductase [Planctomycetota bacterium]
MTDSSSVARRNFFRKSGLMIAGGAIGGAMAADDSQAVSVPQHDSLRVAVIGCGRRARALLEAVLSQDQTIRVVALGDAFASQVQATYRAIKGRHPRQLDPECLRCSGWDAYDQVVRSDADLIYLTAPPVFRPLHFEAAIDEGKHVFLEKPLAANVGDSVKMLGIANRAKQNGLSAFVGFQRRFDVQHQETIDRVRSGAIGRLLLARSYCNVGPLRKPHTVKDEDRRTFEIRNWNGFHWTGGELLLEQHVAGLDRLRNAVGLPVAAVGQGGWSDASALVDHGNTAIAFDHHTVEYEFESGLRLLSQCRRGGSKSWMQTSEHLHGTCGRAELSTGRIFDADDHLIWKSPSRSSNQASTAAQQAFVIDSLRSGVVINEVADAAESNLFALLGQLATRSGRRETWDGMLRSAVT